MCLLPLAQRQTDPVSETFCFWFFRILDMEKVHKLNDFDNTLILARSPSGVAYKDTDSDWKLHLFVSLQVTTNYNKFSTVITA
jgi:hypothetical protein